jgi:excisionase family DNA binding protein|tara:strand:- start:108 stop:368 length:261 start_codon:yes stop_codon:yes gene_type:complete
MALYKVPMGGMQLPQLLTTTEFAKRLGCSPATVRSMIKSKKIFADKKGMGKGTYKIPITELWRMAGEDATRNLHDLIESRSSIKLS